MLGNFVDRGYSPTNNMKIENRQMVRRKKETGLTFSGTSSVTVVRVYFQNKKQPNLRVRCVAVRRRIVLRGSRVLVVEVFPVR